MSNHRFDVSVNGQGLYDITPQVAQHCRPVASGMATVFIQHIRQFADSGKCRSGGSDLQNWLSPSPGWTRSIPISRKAPTICPPHWQRLRRCRSVPVMQGKLALGVWRGSICGNTATASNSSVIVNMIGYYSFSRISSIHFLWPSGSRIMLEKYCSRSLWA